MWGHMLDNIYSLGFTEGTPLPLGHSPSPPPPPILCLPQHQIHCQPFFPNPNADAGRGPGPPPALYSCCRPFSMWRRPFFTHRHRGRSSSTRHWTSSGGTPTAGPPHPSSRSPGAPSSHGYCDKELYHFLESCAPSEAAYLHHCPAPSSRHVSMAVIIVN
jgi:hypothetical protein